MKTLSRISSFVLDLFFPARCALCDRIVKYDECVCNDCLSKVRYYDNYCKTCGFTVCRCESNHAYDKALCMGIYDGVLKEGILRLKSKMSQQMCRFFAEWVRGLPEAENIDAVVFVPMTKKRFKQSGFNHSRALAKYVSAAIDKPLVCNALVKVKDYTHHKLSANERREYVNEAYECAASVKSLSGKTVMLVDDIMTTGATLDKCASLIKDLGAKSVICVCVAKVEKISTENTAHTK